MLTFETATDREVVSVNVTRVPMGNWLAFVGGYVAGLWLVFCGVANLASGRCFSKVGSPHAQLIEKLFKTGGAVASPQTSLAAAKRQIESRKRVATPTYKEDAQNYLNTFTNKEAVAPRLKHINAVEQSLELTTLIK